ncbi:MAG: hypothetical protein COB92_04750 [Robiginitomaculum sp.]|nr:MAG: hypothetical protein COB92_04750 [Robiginitomaculum sp.]
MSRPRHSADGKLDARIAKLRRKILKAERTLVREIKKRQTPCRCQRGEYEFTQADFEEIREMYERARASWLAEHSMVEGVDDV